MPPHKVFLITELLEAILLQTDMRTLLTSAQRVCRHWHSLINDSVGLQTLLFFTPSKEPVMPGQKRRQNPLLEEMWRGVFARQVPIDRDTLTLEKENAYLDEKEASWRRMLFQQPPTSRIGVIEVPGSVDGPLFSQIEVKHNEDYLRWAHLSREIESGLGHLRPGQDSLLMWVQPRRLKKLERKFRRERQFAVSRLADCDVVIFCLVFYAVCEPEEKGPIWDRGSDRWLRPFTEVRVLERRRIIGLKNH